MHTRRQYLSVLFLGAGGALAGCSEIQSVSERTETGAVTRTETSTLSPTTETTSDSSATGEDSGVSGGGGTAIDIEYDYEGHLDAVGNYDGTTVDRRGQTPVTVTVGSEGNGGTFAFGPPAVHVDLGATVQFEWAGGTNSHNVVSDEGLFDSGSPTDQAGVNFEVTFEQAGRYPYYCAPHESLGMRGVVVVGTSSALVEDADSVTTSYDTDETVPTGGETESETESVTPMAGGENDEFGYAVAIEGGTALVAARAEADPVTTNLGSAYVFERTDGTWQQVAQLTPDDPTADGRDQFGSSVALSDDGTTALVGAEGDENDNGSFAGAGYVFTETDGTWQQRAKLVADDGDEFDNLGNSVTLDDEGSTAVLGAPNDSDPNGEFAGSAYIFADDGGTWSQVAKLAADDGDSRDHFGAAVGLSGDGTTALVGADRDEDPNGEQAGSVYVYTATSGDWSQGAKLSASQGTDSEYFGSTLALSSDGTTALIGSTGYDGSTGAAYVFRSSNTWEQTAQLTASDGDSGDEFGTSVAVSEDGVSALVGASRDEDPHGDLAGSAYLFTESDGSWSQQAKLAASNGETGDQFGWSVGLTGYGPTALVGAVFDDGQNGTNAGSAYLFADIGQ